jgi:hypothetical protein
MVDQRFDGLGIPPCASFGRKIIGVPARAAFLRPNCSGSMPILFASMSSTLSTAKAEIGDPGIPAASSGAVALGPDADSWFTRRSGLGNLLLFDHDGLHGDQLTLVQASGEKPGYCGANDRG